MWNGMWYDLQNGIIMRKVIYAKRFKEIFKKKGLKWQATFLAPILKSTIAGFLKRFQALSFKQVNTVLQKEMNKFLGSN